MRRQCGLDGTRSVLTRGRLQQVANGFTLDGVPYQILGATMYSLFYDWAYGGMKSFVATQVIAMRQMSITSPRIFVTVEDLDWENGYITGYPVVLDPTLSTQLNLYGRLSAFATMMRDEGFFPIYVVFGSCRNGFETQDIRTDVCRNVAATLQQFPCLAEISPDPVGTDIGRDGGSIAYDPYDEAQRLVTVYKTADINNPVAAGAGATSTEIDRPYSDWMSYAPVRSIADDKWGWIVDQVTNSCVQRNGNIRAVLATTPMNAGGNVDPDANDENVDHWWAWGLLCQFLQMNSCFTAEPLLGSEFLDSTIFYQLQAWVAGRQTVGWKDWPQFYITEGITGSSDVGDTPWTYTDALLVAGRHNGVIGMAVACKTPLGWDPTAGLTAGWTAVIIEQRNDAALVGLLQA